MNEVELIDGLTRGCRKAQEEAYLVYKDRIYATTKKYVNTQEDAEELTQDVFVKAFRKIDQFKGKSSLSTWLIKIAINTSKNFLDCIKREKELINKEIVVNEEIEWQSGYSTPEELLTSQEGKNALIKATSLLPEKQKTAFLLFYIEELSQLEIAEVMGLSIDAVESLIHRAKTKFKSLFKIVK